MIPRRVSLRNFLSFGEVQEIDFADGEALWCIGGPNGVGKSAVFDAITYCLFAEHRDGKQGAKNLIKHGESGFTVAYEFALDSSVYRITRSLGKKTTQSVEECDDTGSWKVIPNLINAGAVDDWVRERVGLDFKAFTASVMLRQGEAADIVNATGKKRHEILGKVIGLDRFQSLAERIATGTRTKRTTLDNLLKRREAEPGVDPADVSAAEAAQADADAVRSKAESEKAACAERVSLARRWTELEGEYAKISALLAAASERAKHAESIRSRKDRHDELEKVLPPLGDWIILQGEEASLLQQKEMLEPKLTATGAALTEAEQTAAETKRECERLRERLPELERCNSALKSTAERLGRELALAEELEQLEAELAAYPSDLAERVAQATQRHREFDAAERAAESAFTVAEADWKRARDEQAKIRSLETGVKCKACGQPVTAEHAEAERRRITSEMESLAAVLERAKTSRDTAQIEVKQSAQSCEDLRLRFQFFTQRDAIRRAKHESLATLGVHDSAAELRLRTEATERERQSIEKERADAADAAQHADTAAKQADRNFQRIQTEDHAIRQQVTALDQRQAILRDRRASLVERLNVRYHEFTVADAERLREEFDELRQDDVPAQFQALQGDYALNDERRRTLEDLQAKRDALPGDCHIPVADAQRVADEAGAAFTVAERSFTHARDGLRSLQARVEASVKLQQEIFTAEREERLHARLRDLLGRNGLQRELIRDAEREIVGHADTIVRNLSNGDLTLELDPEKGDDEALVLRVRRPDHADATPVMFLSGSQKFRVAIALALAIGRFASTGARPIECVIIDEGFGNLDKDGLEATAQELKRLKQYLKRIILVSHQEEFTDHFPAMIRLKPSETGTTVETTRGA